MSTAYIITCNDNPQAVVIDRNLVVPTREALKLQHLREQIHSPQINDDASEYEKLYKWAFQGVPLIQIIDRLGQKIPRSHVPETFPKPESLPLPGQTQLVRKQLTAVPANPNPQSATPIPAATTLSQRSDASPGVQEPIRAVAPQIGIVLDMEQVEEGFACRCPAANNNIIGVGLTQEEATADYFARVSREKEGDAVTSKS
jgi:hypothetical protein